MLLDLKELLSREQNRIDFDYKMLPGELFGDLQFTEPVTVTGCATNSAGYAELRIHVDAPYRTACDRCADMADFRLTFDFAFGLALELNNEDNDDYLVVPTGELDIDDTVRTQMILHLPSKHLCSENCKGLCAGCGANLNREACRCAPRIDPRLEALKKLL